MVSNGLDVVKTDADGRWSLPVRDGDSVFVIKPAGWALPVDTTTNLLGSLTCMRRRSPNLGFASPVWRRPVRCTEHRFGCIVWMRRRGSMRCCSPISAESLNESGISATIGVVVDGRKRRSHHACDIMFDDLSYYPRYNRLSDDRAAVVQLRGNHDMNLEAPDNTYAAETFNGCSARGGTRSSMAARRSSCWIMSITSGPIREAERVRQIPRLFRGTAVGLRSQRVGERAARRPVVISFHIPLKTLATDAANNTLISRIF